MDLKIMKFLLVVLVAFIIFCIYSIVKMHDRAIKLSKTEDVKEYMVREKERLEKARKTIAEEEQEMKQLEAIKSIGLNELESKTGEKEDEEDGDELAEDMPETEGIID